MKCLIAIFAIGVLGAFNLQGEILAGETSVRMGVSLSMMQEAEAAIDRAEQWLQHVGCPTNDLAQQWLFRYALKSEKSAPMTVARCDWTPLEQAMPKSITVTADTFEDALSQAQISPKQLFGLQRDVPDVMMVDKPLWRQSIVERLINQQQVDARGGFWGTREDTVWAVLTLRALLNASAPVIKE